MRRRIVSLVPSLTHMLCDVGLRSDIAGCTKFCVVPPGLQHTARLVGGTKDPDIAAIRSLAPTHILVNTEENKPEHIEVSQQIAPTFVSYPKDPHDVPAMIRRAGEFLGANESVDAAATAVERELTAIGDAPKVKRRFLYLIWREPYMVAGHDTYISAMLNLLGWENVAPPTDRYPTVTVDGMAMLKPDVLLCSSEPYPFRKRDVLRMTEAWPGRQPEFLKTDGQLCSWYGTMTVEALQALRAAATGKPQRLMQPFD
jgi:ABC-type Fe3+-hydroxamate transport system substrate-binding protein